MDFVKASKCKSLYHRLCLTCQLPGKRHNAGFVHKVWQMEETAGLVIPISGADH